MSARDRILAKLKAGLATQPTSTQGPAVASMVATTLPDVASWYATHRIEESKSDKVARFRRLIELAHAEVHSVNEDNWLNTLRAVLEQRQIGKLLVAEDTPHGEAVLNDFPRHGIDCATYDLAIEAWKTEMFQKTPASLTLARAAIAETGTLILWPDADEPRLMSLVPPLHIVLLDAKTIYNTFYEAAQKEGWANGLPTNSLLISGPSKTADIQQTLAYGAHGPKELVVLLKGEA